jgi:hypothetical protein
LSNVRYALKSWPWLLGALIGYFLPWVWHSAAALTANAYDLAEWANLHPAVRNGSTPMLAPFLLRFDLAGIALLCALRSARATNRGVRWLYGGLSLILAITLLPPIDFFRSAGDDPNYRQQFYIAVATFIALAVIIFLWRKSILPRYQAILEALLALATLIAAIMGEGLAFGVVRSLQIDVTPGGGVIVFVVFMLLALITAPIPSVP